jgi:hypothetical protein
MSSPDRQPVRTELWQGMDEMPFDENPFFLGYKPFELYDAEGNHVGLIFDTEDQTALAAYGPGYSAIPAQIS